MTAGKKRGVVLSPKQIGSPIPGHGHSFQIQHGDEIELSYREQKVAAVTHTGDVSIDPLNGVCVEKVAKDAQRIVGLNLVEGLMVLKIAIDGRKLFPRHTLTQKIPERDRALYLSMGGQNGNVVV